MNTVILKDSNKTVYKKIMAKLSDRKKLDNIVMFSRDTCLSLIA